MVWYRVVFLWVESRAVSETFESLNLSKATDKVEHFAKLKNDYWLCNYLRCLYFYIQSWKSKFPAKSVIIVLCCFVDMEGTYAEYEEWSEHGVPETVMHQYKKALQQMEKCKPFEEALVMHFAKYDVHSFCVMFLNDVDRFCEHCCCFAADGSRNSKVSRISGLHRLWTKGGRPSTDPDNLWARSVRELPGARHVGQIHHIPRELLVTVWCDAVFIPPPRLMYKTLLFISFVFQTVLTIFNYFSFSVIGRIVSWSSKTWFSPLMNVQSGTAPGPWDCGRATCSLWRGTEPTIRPCPVRTRAQLEAVHTRTPRCLQYWNYLNSFFSS